MIPIELFQTYGAAFGYVGGVCSFVALALVLPERIRFWRSRRRRNWALQDAEISHKRREMQKKYFAT